MRWLKYYQFLSEKNILWCRKFSFTYRGLTGQTFRNDENLSYYGFNKSLHMTRTALRALSLQKYWVLSIARARCKLKQLCCYIDPDFSVQMSDVSEHSEFDFEKKKFSNTSGFNSVGQLTLLCTSHYECRYLGSQIHKNFIKDKITRNKHFTQQVHKSWTT